VPGQPVVLVFEGKQVYHSGNLNGNVQEHFKVDMPPITAQSTSELNIELRIGVKVQDALVRAPPLAGCSSPLADTTANAHVCVCVPRTLTTRSRWT
jgi:hypothetical protein